MLNLKINSTFHIGVKDSQTRAFINDKDIHPKTGRLGIRVYKSDGNCFQKLWILIQSLFGRTLTIIDGSGKEILFSKNSLKNWLEFHGKKVSSYDDQLAKIIDGIFAEQNPKATSEPLNTKKQEVISQQKKTETVNNCTADSGVKNLEPKETVAQEKKIGNVITREPLDKKFEFLRNNKQHALKNEEIKNFLIEMLNKGDTSDPLYKDYFDLLIDILGSQGLREEDFKKINESLREEIKKGLSK